MSKFFKENRGSSFGTPFSLKDKDYFIPVGIFFLALTLRLIYLFFLKKYYIYYDFPASDVDYYQKWAQEISHHDWIGHKVFWGMPLYPYFLAVLNRILFENQFLVRLTHLALGSMNCVLVYYIAKYVFSSRVAILAAILMASNFVMIYYDWLLMPITLIIALSLLIVLTLLQFVSFQYPGDGKVNPKFSGLLNQNIKPPEWFFLGLLIGLGTLGDGKILLFSAMLVAFIACFSFKLIYGRKVIITLILGIMCVLFSVTIRNKLISGDWILISAQSGFSFYVGNNAHTDGIFENLDFIRPTHDGQDDDQRIMAEKILKRTLTPSEVSSFWRNKAISFIRNSPIQYINLLIKKSYYFFVEHERAHDIDLLLQKEWKERFDLNSFSLICPLALLALVINLRYPTTIFINFFLLSQLLFSLLFFVETKHRATILPFLIIYESYSLVWLVNKIKKQQYKMLFIGGIGLIASFIIFHPFEMKATTLQYLKDYKSGIVYEKRGEFEKAEEFYFKALQTYPKDTNLLYNLGNIFFIQGKTQEAAEYYKKAITLNPNQVDVIYNLAYAYEKSFLLDDAMMLYQQALELQPDSIDIHFRLGNVYQVKGMCQEAIMHYQEIIKNTPQASAQINVLIGQCSQK